MKLRQRQEEPSKVTLVTSKRGHDDRPARRLLERLVQRHRQHWMRTDFDEETMPITEQRLQRFRETHRLPKVSVPVLAIELGALDWAAGHRRVERDPAPSRRHRR